jgi:uncharacterized protein (DUF2147 family)
MRVYRFNVYHASAVAITLLCGASVGPALADPTGLWQASDGGRMQVNKCGAAICANIVSVSPHNDPATGKPWSDKYNPDQSKRKRPLAGVQVLISMRPSGPGKWSGRLYNSEDGQTYVGNLVELSRTGIRVEGCALGICGGQNLTRVR